MTEEVYHYSAKSSNRSLPILPHPFPLPKGEETPFPTRGKGWG